jgi:MoxR-like ATPase
MRARNASAFRGKSMTENTDPALVAEYKEASELLRKVREETQKKIFGQEDIIDNVLTTMVSGGHVLLLGVPGLAKTLLVNTLSTVMGLQSKRVQFTPDKMPSDITGSEVMETDENGKRHFRFIPGPVFTEMLLADEINRASPRTQSALLEAMQEYRVTEGGETRDLPNPFFVLATQNPLEQEGTYPLPEAQLDRFLMQLELDYPDYESELKIGATVQAYKRGTVGQPKAEGEKPEAQKDFKAAASVLQTVMNPQDLIRMQKLVDKMPVDKEVVKYVVNLVRSGRPRDELATADVKKYVAWPPGPRTVQALIVAAKGRALLEGRLSPSKDDVKTILQPVLGHRMTLNYHAKADNVTLPQVIETMVAVAEGRHPAAAPAAPRP